MSSPGSFAALLHQVQQLQEAVRHLAALHEEQRDFIQVLFEVLKRNEALSQAEVEEVGDQLTESTRERVPLQDRILPEADG